MRSKESGYIEPNIHVKTATGPESIIAANNGADYGVQLSAAHLPWLDGIRGFSALWVLLFHTQLLCGMGTVPILSYGGLAVDLFMMMSGFLMVHQYILRQSREPWNSSHTWLIFWTRRLFRVAPLYYVLLTLALLLGPSLGASREAIAQHWPQAYTPTARYTEHSLFNILSHVTFIFGTIPRYSFATPLPDWSIGLEAQFYFAFPLLMLLVHKLGAGKACLLIIISSVLLEYLFPTYFKQFLLPTLLPLKLYMFCTGMLLALSRWHLTSMLQGLAISIGLVTLYCGKNGGVDAYARIAMVGVIFYLSTNGSLPSFDALDRLIVSIRQTLASRLAVFTGDTSYSVYLVHLLVLIPTLGYLAGTDFYPSLSDFARFSICLLIIIPPTYFFAWLFYLVIEQPGIQLGKWIVKYQLK